MKTLFSITKPTPNHDPLLGDSFHPRLVKSWVEQLPRIDPTQMKEMMISQLEIMNSVVINGETRLASLELMRGSYLFMLESLQQIHDGFPFNNDEKKCISQLHRLIQLYTSGYWIALENLQKESENSNSLSTLLQTARQPFIALQRLMRGIYDLLLLACFQHLPIPDWLWMDMHTLLGHAEQMGKAETSLRSSEVVSLDRLSCKDVYKQAMLLSVSGYQGLRQQEILILSQALSESSKLLTLSYKCPNKSRLAYGISTEEDGKPFLLKAQNYPPETRYLDCDLLISKSIPTWANNTYLDSRFSMGVYLHQDIRSQMTIPSHDLIEYLNTCWNEGSIPAGDMLFKDRVPRLIAIGLNAIHDQFDTENSQQSRQIAETSSDRALILRNKPASRMGVGSLVAYAKIGEEGLGYGLGVISRVATNRLNEHLEFELKQLAFPVLSAGIQPMRQGAGNTRVYQRALIYNESLLNGAQRSILIVASQRLRNGNRVRLLSPTGPYSVVLDNQFSPAVGYTAFVCRRAANDPGA